MKPLIFVLLAVPSMAFAQGADVSSDMAKTARAELTRVRNDGTPYNNEIYEHRQNLFVCVNTDQRRSKLQSYLSNMNDQKQVLVFRYLDFYLDSGEFPGFVRDDAATRAHSRKEGDLMVMTVNFQGQLSHSEWAGTAKKTASGFVLLGPGQHVTSEFLRTTGNAAQQGFSHILRTKMTEGIFLCESTKAGSKF